MLSLLLSSRNSAIPLAANPRRNPADGREFLYKLFGRVVKYRFEKINGYFADLGFATISTSTEAQICKVSIDIQLPAGERGNHLN